MTDRDDSKTFQPTATSIERLELREELNGARIAESADRMDRPKSTIHGHLMTLRAEEFVI